MIKIFNELEYAETLLKKGFLNNSIIGDIRILAKYFKYKGEKPANIKKLIIEFCFNFDKNFNLLLHEQKIDSIIKKESDTRLRVPIDVIVTQNEVEKIKELKNFRYEKIIFTMLVIAKYNKFTNVSNKNSISDKYFFNGKLTQAFRLAHSSQKKNENIGFILYQNGYISDTRKKDTFIITFTDVNDISEPKIIVNDINNIYLFWKASCENCGKEIKKNSNSHILCQDCYKERKKEQNRLWISEFRKM